LEDDKLAHALAEANRAIRFYEALQQSWLTTHGGNLARKLDEAKTSWERASKHLENDKLEYALAEGNRTIRSYEVLQQRGLSTYGENLARNLTVAGIALRRQERLEDAIDTLKRAEEIFAASDATSEHDESRALCHSNHAEALIRRGKRGDAAHALEDYTRAMGIWQGLSEREDGNGKDDCRRDNYANQRARLLTQRANYYSRTPARLDDAIEDYDEAIAVQRELVRNDSLELRHHLANSLTQRANTLVKHRKLKPELFQKVAVEDYNEAIEHYRSLCKPSENSRIKGEHDFRDDLAWSRTNRGIARLELNNPDDALDDFRLGVETYRKLVETEKLKEFEDDLAWCLSSYARALKENKQGKKAEDVLGEAVRIFERLVFAEEKTWYAKDLRDALAAMGSFGENDKEKSAALIVRLLLVKLIPPPTTKSEIPMVLKALATAWQELHTLDHGKKEGSKPNLRTIERPDGPGS